MDIIRKMPLRKILAMWAATLASFVIVYSLVADVQLSQQIKDIVIYLMSITIGAYFASSSYEAVHKKEGDKGGQ